MPSRWSATAALGLALCCLPVPALHGAHGAFPQDRAAVEKILELFGLEEFSRVLPETILAALDQQQGQIDPEIYPKLQLAFEQAFTSEKIYEEMAAAFSERADAERFAAALEWLRSPLSRKMTALEIESARPQAMEEILEFGAMLDAIPPPVERRALIERLDQAVRSSEVSLEVQLAILRALLEGVNPLLDDEKRTSVERIEAIVSQARQQLEPSARQQVRIAMLYTYRDVSGEELLEYIEFWETDDGRWLSSATHAALLRAIGAASRKAGAFMGLQGVEVAPKD